VVAVAEQLALQGGPKAVTLDQKEAAAWPIVEAEEIEAATRVVTCGRWSTGPESRALEQEFAAYHGVDYALTVCNGSTALQTCYFALGVGPGDEVIVPAETFFSTATAVLNVGGIPIFADVDT
jgi:dTDP-4-amino-4,6-dideoxygalactose transaminase